MGRRYIHVKSTIADASIGDGEVGSVPGDWRRCGNVFPGKG